MASGFGYFHSSDNIVAGYGNIYVSGFIAQNVNTSTRKVTITVTALLTYYRRTGGSWNPGTGVIFENYNNGNYIRATLDGSSASDGPHLGLAGANTTLTVGNYYDRYTGGVNSYDVGMVVKSTTYNYAASGAAITKGWSCSINYAGSVLTVSGSVTTDPIPASGSAPSNGYVNDLDSTASSGFPTINASSAGVNDGGLTLTKLQFYVGEEPYYGGQPVQLINFTNGSAISLNQLNSLATSGGIDIKYNTKYYAGILATNSQGNYRYYGPAITTVPAPAFYSLLNTNADNVEISYTTTADGGALPVTVQYTIDGGTTWLDGPTISDSSVSKQGRITVGNLSPSTTYTIGLRTATATANNETGSISVTTKTAKLYGSVSGSSKEIVKLYGSVGGESKSIKKLYGSVNGRAKLIYKEN